MTAGCRATVVVAVEHSSENVPDIMAHLDPRAHADVQFLICHATDNDPLRSVGPLPVNVRAIESRASSRIPHMWRDGILAASSDKVALLTAHCVPTRGWIGAMLDLGFGEADAGIGGYFTNSEDASAMDWAIHLLRYVNYSRPRSDGNCSNIAADNSIYRRTEIVSQADLLPHGFWEPEFHKRFFAKGLHLCLAPTLEVIHRNRYSKGEFAQQRRDHGREFGLARAREMPTPRLVLYVLAAPLIAVVLFGKIRAGMARHGWSKQVPPGTAGWLGFFVLHWALGESRGLVYELGRRMGIRSCRSSPKYR